MRSGAKFYLSCQGGYACEYVENSIIGKGSCNGASNEYIYISLVVTSLKILRLETIVVIRIRILWLVYARNVHITSRIKPVIKGLQMI